MPKSDKPKNDSQDRAVQPGRLGGRFRVIYGGLFFLKKKWRRLTVFAFLFLVVILLVDSGISIMYDYWDVGSNSWFDRFKSDTEQFHRGAALLKQDQFGDQFSTVKYLPQGWKPSESMWFYNTTQGSDLLPYDFFIALERPPASGAFRSDRDMNCFRFNSAPQKPSTFELFRSNENMNCYRYLPQEPTRSNPDGLPVGFVKDTYNGKEYLGFTCAACHTGQLNYKGAGIRIDGGPAGSDMGTFLEDLSRALSYTLKAKEKENDFYERFVARVKDRGNFASEEKIHAALEKFSNRLSEYVAINHRRSGSRYGYSRLDAFGRIYNRVLEHVLNPQQLRAVLRDLVRDNNLAGKKSVAGNDTVGNEEAADNDSVEEKEEPVSEAEIEALLNSEAVNKVLTEDQRDDIVARIGQLLPKKVQVRLRDRLFNEPNAPVSYPFLWDIPQHDYVQWNGLAANGGLGPIGRNAGEVIGVFATLDWVEKKGFSVSAVVSGQGFGDHINFRSSIKVHNLRLMENQLKSLESPRWPEDILPKIDKDRKARGATLFADHCARCHTQIARDDPDRRVVAQMTKLGEIGTDPKMAVNGVNSSGLSGILRNQYVSAGPGEALINEQAPAAALLTKATLSVVATPDQNKNFFRRWWDWIYELASEVFGNQIKASLKQGNYDPDTTASPYKSLFSYKARSLNGIWATAPYLHNGSVPTLYDLLLPKKRPGDPDSGEYRPEEFQVGSREFDPEKVGLKSSGYHGFTFRTTFLGNSNAGHIYGTRDLDREQRLDLLEYLKSL